MTETSRPDNPAVDAARAAAELLETTTRLIDVLEAEIDMLRGMQPNAMQELQEDKIVLAAAYEAQLKRLHAEPAAIETLHPDLRDELRHATALFNDVLAENERSLRAARRVTEGVLSAIADAAERHGARDGYAASGARRGQTAGQPHSLALNARC